MWDFLIYDSLSIYFSLFFIVTIRVVNLSERTETSVITGSDQTVRVVYKYNT